MAPTRALRVNRCDASLRSRAGRARLQAELLEDRIAPAVYDVTTVSDVVNAGDGVLSLREAVLAANASVGVVDTINLPAGTYTLTLIGAAEEGGATGDLDVWDDVTIQRAGAGTVVVDGNLGDRVFDIQTGRVTLANLTIRNGRVLSAVTGSPDGQGGGVRSRGNLTLTGCVVSDNLAIGADAVAGSPPGIGVGGGVCQLGGTLELIGDTISSNLAIGGGITAAGSTAVAGGAANGGGVYITTGVLTVTNCTVAGNRASGGVAVNTVGGATGGAAAGGGIQIATTGAHQILNCTISTNSAVGGDGRGQTGGFGGAATGGGAGLSASATMTNSTVSGNVATGGVGTTIGAGTSGSGGNARGGGLVSPAGLISNSTVTLNAAAGGPSNRAAGTGQGGGFATVTSVTASTAFRSTIVAGNTATTASPDVDRPSTFVATSQGNNLVGNGTGAPAFVDGANGDQVGGASRPVIEPRLGPLADNGGPTQTHAVLNGSPAVNRGSNAAGLAADQRGQPRVAGVSADVGAFESVFTPPTATAGSLPDVNVAGGTPYTFTVMYADDVAVDVVTLGNGDIVVAGPNGFSSPADFVSVDIVTNGTPRVATYRFTPPGGAWDGGDYGTYTLAPGLLQVADTSGSYIAATPIGSFRVLVSSTLVVTTTNDSGPGSLRDAIGVANARAGVADTVTFDPTVFGTSRTITLTSGQLTVTDPVTVQGPGAALLTVSGNNASRIFRLDGPGVIEVTLAGMTLSGGRTAGNLITDGGGAIYDLGETLTIRDCVLTGNTAAAYGGAIDSVGGALTILNSSITNNTVTGTGSGGGGISQYDSSLVIQRSTVAANSAPSGGGVYFSNSGNLSVLESTVSGNISTAGDGGGILFSGVPYLLLIRNSTVSGNTAAGRGGGIAHVSFPGSVTIQNSTFVGNVARVSGGGIAIPISGMTATVTSSIVWGNSAPAGPDIDFPGSLVLTHSAVGNASGTNLATGSVNNLPFGTNPLLGPLADNGGPTKTYRLLAGSPAVDAGSNPAGLATDQRGPGFLRTIGTAVDIGATEGVPSAPMPAVGGFSNVTTAGATTHTMNVTYYDDVAVSVSTLGTGDIRITGPGGFNVLATFVSVDASTNGSPRRATYRFTPPGGQWNGPDNGLYTVSLEPNQVADTSANFAAAVDIGTFVVLLPNTYVVTTTADGGVGSLRDAVAKANASAPAADTILFDPAVFGAPRTISLISGELLLSDSVTIQGPGAALLSVNGNDASRLFAVNGPGTIAVTFTGMTLTRGLVPNSAAGPRSGGAIQSLDDTVTVSDCNVSANFAPDGGGAIYVGGPGGLTIRRSTFTANSTRNVGGGAINRVGTGPLTVQDSTIVGNTQTTSGSGGAIYLSSSGTALVENTTVADNSALVGGGLNSFGGTNLTIVGSTFSGNTATTGRGGALNLDDNFQLLTVIIRNSTLSGNRAPSANGQGGAIALRSSLGGNSLAIQNSTIVGNSAGGANGGGLFLDTGGLVATITSSIVSGNTNAASPDIWSFAQVAATNSAMGSSSGFTLTPGSGNNLPYGANLRLAPLANYGGLTKTHALRAGSPAVDAGSNPAGLTTDQRGSGYPRTVGTLTDIGAYEGVTPPPTATGILADVTAARTSPYTFTVQFADDAAVNVASLGTGDVRVTGPNGFNVVPDFIGVDLNSDGTPRLATYGFAPPGGAWDVPDVGTYTVSVEPNQVTDIGGDAAVAGPVGTFRVILPTTWIVTNANDSGPGSLRDTIAQANAFAPTGDTIVFDPVYFATPRTITLTSGEVVITDAVSIVGPGSGRLTISGNTASRIFTISVPGVRDVSLSGLTLADAKNPDPFFFSGGGAITSVDENLTLTDLVFRSNSGAVYGGGVYVIGTVGRLTVVRCTFLNNTAATGGGLYVSAAATVLIDGCSFDGNRASNGSGGGITVDNSGANATANSNVTIANSSFTGNVAGNGGGGGVQLQAVASVRVSNSTFSGNNCNVLSPGGGAGMAISPGPFSMAQTVVIENATITGNTAGAAGGGVALDSTRPDVAVNITSSIIAGNQAATKADVAAAVVTVTRSAIGDANGFTLGSGSGNNLPYGANLMLGSLADNGGITKTHALLAGSPAIDAGSNPSGLGTDQRGVGFPRTAGAATDIGAFESVVAGTPSAAAGPLPEVTQRGGTAYDFTVIFRDDVAVSVASLGNGDVRVTGPNGFSALPTFRGADLNTNGTPRTATYRLTPPGGMWDFADTGTYFVDLEPNQVTDTGGNFVPIVRLGQFAVIPPVGVVGVQVNDGSAQRSRVTSLTVSFDGSLQLLGAGHSDSFSLRRADGLVIALKGVVDNTGGRTVVTLSFSDFSGSGLEFGSLPDGNYTLTLFGGTSRSVPNGPLLDADGDGLPGGDLTVQFHRLFGDVNGDKAVNGLDLALFRSAFGTVLGNQNYDSSLDFNGDGAINGLDLAAYRTRFGTSLP